ncbi:MAG TPA: hypothetical protein VKH34_10870 [Vicinamibacterales bacterium]|nr:hypothetical protein [Vicinamibacterales bacterium]
MNEQDLERLAQRELQRLPAPRAPHSLLPRVMAAVEAWAARPWYTRAWFTWPVGWQAASVAAVALLVTGAVLVGPHVQAAASSMLAAVQLFAGGVSDAAPVETTANGARILWRTLLEPLATYALVVIVLMFLACAVFGTALNHVVIERAEQR